MTPCEELADGGPLRLARGSKGAATQKGQASQGRRQGETERQKARPGAVWTPRWSADRRAPSARGCPRRKAWIEKDAPSQVGFTRLAL